MARSKRPTPTLLRVPVIVLAVAAGLAIGSAVHAARTQGLLGWLPGGGGPPYVAVGQLFEVDGRRLYLDCRGQGSPTVVLDAGSGSDSATWAAALDGLAAITRTCAYDRAGRGRSDPADRHTLADAASKLSRLLDVAEERPPFVAVGHSLGGAYARAFAAAHRAEVAALVLVESFEPGLQSTWIHPLLGPLREEYERGLNSLRRVVSDVDRLDWPVSEAQLESASITGLPLEVLMAVRQEPRLDGPTNERIAAAWKAAFESLAPGHTRYETVAGAGHMLHMDRPDRVIDAIRRVVRGGGPSGP
jgi:pimeloyl-ACP methyl ester carboxylesterase